MFFDGAGRSIAEFETEGVSIRMLGDLSGMGWIVLA